MRRAEVSTMTEVKAIIARAAEAIVYTDQTSGKWVVEYYAKQCSTGQRIGRRACDHTAPPRAELFVVAHFRLFVKRFL